MHRSGPRPDPPDIIHIRSDSEEPQRPMRERAPMQLNRIPMPTQPSGTQSSSTTLVAQSPVAFIDLTQVPSASHRSQASTSAPSFAPVSRSRRSESSASVKSVIVRIILCVSVATCTEPLQRPRWLQDDIAEIEEKYPRARFVVSAQGMLAADRPENWEVQCNQCEEYVVSQ